MEWIVLPEEGELMTYSIVHQKPQGYENYPDYTIGIVKTGNINLMAWVIGEPKVGKKVKITTDGNRILAKVIE
jgi:uncharacterized OB-fold protein